jgi:hypothetical protein
MLTSLGKTRFILAVQLLWIGGLVPAMALGVHRNGIVGAAAAHIVIIAPVVLPAYIVALKRATGIPLTMLGRAVLPPLLAASAAALAAKVSASAFASPPVQLMAGVAAGVLVYLALAAPQGIAWLSHEQAKKLRALRLFRFYNAAAQTVGLPVGNGPEHRRKRGRHRAHSTPHYGWGLGNGRR